MLMSEGFSKLVQVWDRGDLTGVSTTLIVDRVIISLFQVLVRTLMAQNGNGSWGSSNSREVTAYAILTISKASALPFTVPIRAQIENAIADAQKFLLCTKETAPSYVWVEKVSYGSTVLCESYVLAALKASSKVPAALPSKATSLATIPLVDLEHLSQICFGSSMFDSTEAWKPQAALIESCLFRPYLQRLAGDYITGVEDENTFEIVPFAWTACNYSAKQPLNTTNLRQRMGASLLKQLQNRPFKQNGSAPNGTGHGTNGNKQVNGNLIEEGLTTTTKGDSKHEDDGATEISCRANQACVRGLAKTAPTWATVVHVPDELTFLLPTNFTGELTNTFFKGTITMDASVNRLLKSAAQATFISYDDDFARIVGSKVSAQRLTTRPGSGAFFEAGVYIPPLEEVWFTSTYSRYETCIRASMVRC